MIAAGRYARLVLTQEPVFVLASDPVTGHVSVRRMDGIAHWVAPRALAPLTDDENMAAAVEWMIATGQLTVIDDSTDLDALLGA